ncbi:hypothetical protein NGM36_26185 [Streptomyces mutabilis]|uniref:hypothetical protein n=1 Tax=Streptomyces mutabilis TaxID=67332 RepID=UPI0022BA24C1|nr:hypothetical protein [Streptomyces mutabilis]MCZ9353213.1 hypothetical protein [Streptomyces mutabilis]
MTDRPTTESPGATTALGVPGTLARDTAAARAVRLAANARHTMLAADDAETTGTAARELGLWWALAEAYGATPADVLAAEGAP